MPNLDPTGQPYEPAEIEGAGGADDLRTAIADFLEDGCATRMHAETLADGLVDDVLTDPVRRLALLELVGDVVGDVWLPDYFVSGSTTDFQGYGVEPLQSRRHFFKAVAVRPRGEATDA